jgi:iron-sulfur cluster repair protein YtfE (RIC family)
MATIDRNHTVREILDAHPELRPVFETLGLNHCCGAHLSLTEAAASAGVPLERALAALVERLAAPATVAS